MHDILVMNSMISCRQKSRKKQLNLTLLRHIYIKVVFVEHHTHFNVLVYVSQRIKIEFEDEDHAVYISVR